MCALVFRNASLPLFSSNAPFSFFFPPSLPPLRAYRGEKHTVPSSFLHGATVVPPWWPGPQKLNGQVFTQTEEALQPRIDYVVRSFLYANFIYFLFFPFFRRGDWSTTFFTARIFRCLTWYEFVKFFVLSILI